MVGLKNKAITISILILCGLFLSCAGPQTKEDSTKGIYHRVKKGETAYSIARAYKISLKTLADTNGIDDPSVLKEGAVLFIPGALYVIDDVMIYVKGMDVKTAQDTLSQPPKTEPQAKEREKEVAPKNDKHEETAVAEEETKKDQVKIFIWPVEGTIKTRFGRQPNKTFHNWIRIAAKEGAPVKAAAAGTVIFSSHLKDYGQTVIIRHKNDFTTVYTHLDKRYVKVDQSVKQGEKIATVGTKEATGAAYINFEIRINGKASDPVLYLP